MNNNDKIEFVTLQSQHIEAIGLDPIEVYWHNYGQNRGMVTICCYGNSWTAYFGAMPEDSIQGFFREAGADYLTTKLTKGQWLKNSKAHQQYVRKLVEAIKEKL